MRKLIKTLFIACLTFSWLNACRKSDDSFKRQEQVQNLLKSGRKMRIPGSHADHGMFLTKGPVHTQEISSTGNISRLVFDTSLMPSVLSSSVLSYLENWVSENRGNLGLSWTDLREAPIFFQTPKENLHVWQFQRWESDLPVRDAFLKFFMVGDKKGGFRLSEVTNQTFAGSPVINPGATDPGFSELSSLTGLSGLSLLNSRILLVPGLDEEGREVLVRAAEFEVKKDADEEILTLTIASGSKNLLEVFSNRIYVEHSFVAKTFQSSPLDAQKTEIPLAFINVSGSTLITDGDGVADLPVTALTQSLTLSGMRAQVLNGAGTSSPAEATSITLTGQQDEDRTVFDSLSGAGVSGMITYTAIQRINRLVRGHLTPAEASILNTPIPAYVDVDTIGTCNAFYAPGETSYMVFYQAGDNCANTGTLVDVVAHEWCHALDDKTGQPGILDAAFSEAIGDICSSFLSDSSELARGFFLNNPSLPLRSLANNLRFPEDQNQDPHIEGLIVAGAVWDLKVLLEEKYGPSRGSFLAQRLFFRSLITTDSYLNLYNAMIMLNDDDNNLASPSPDLCEINKAFSDHGLSVPDTLNCPSAPKGDEAAENYRPDPDIFLGFETSKEVPAKAQWIVSAKEASSAKICVGAGKDCLSGKIPATLLSRTGRRNDRDFFSGGEVPADPGIARVITIMIRHYYGELSYHEVSMGLK